jgi:DNA-binding NtrC family response regulator
VLESRTVRRVGDTQERAVDVRVIAATNRDLRQEVNRGTFREDLYFRLSVIVLRIPPLRERIDDIPLLADHFLRQLGAADRLTEALVAELCAHPWPGNVRELRNFIEQMVAIGDTELPDAQVPPPSELAPNFGLPFKQAKQQLVARFERLFLAKLLADSDGNISAAARKTGLDRMHLFKLLRQHGMR